ncbi:CCA tRNA nucleotidyltransferase [Trichothermofontia sichuanensis B231]|uniref:CCA tRNA nucleotidyltransferase n=1 Tax=Trichothermofontia sichuanensis TaxID=3045816 RepID=UPI0022462D74|nr:CCA tRNA nucleotidyltransferase [Trichothermofontia sichuanensis]UZQ55570.1 CCA tRNA nucleotidyltransferase [Trichothermofontia sichuanensis B231]
MSVSCERSPTLLSPQTWPFSLSALPNTAVLVGGAVRDALLGRDMGYLDLDFVLPDRAVEVARQLAHQYRAGFVVLDATRQIARVVFAQATVDFAQQEGESLEADLRRRDFTVNAIAYNPHTQTLIDPLNGCQDIQQHQLRMVAIANLQADPLRVLRAYRQAAQLGFTIAPPTQAALSQSAPLLQQVAAERIQTELNYLLNHPNGGDWLVRAWQDGVLTQVIPLPIAQPQIDHLQAIAPTLSRLAASGVDLRSSLATPLRETEKPGSYRGTDPRSQSWLGIVRLTSLLLPTQPLSVTPDHLDAVAIALNQLKYSRAVSRAVLLILQTLPSLVAVPETIRSQYLLFREVDGAFPALAVVALAAGCPLAAIAPLIQRFLDPSDRVAHPLPLLSGRDLMHHLGLQPGPQVGHLLTELQVAQAEARIHTPAEALTWAMQYWQQFLTQD